MRDVCARRGLTRACTGHELVLRGGVATLCLLSGAAAERLRVAGSAAAPAVACETPSSGLLYAARLHSVRSDAESSCSEVRFVPSRSSKKVSCLLPRWSRFCSVMRLL